MSKTQQKRFDEIQKEIWQISESYLMVKRNTPRCLALAPWSIFVRMNSCYCCLASVVATVNSTFRVRQL